MRVGMRLEGVWDWNDSVGAQLILTSIRSGLHLCVHVALHFVIPAIVLYQ